MTQHQKRVADMKLATQHLKESGYSLNKPQIKKDYIDINEHYFLTEQFDKLGIKYRIVLPEFGKYEAKIIKGEQEALIVKMIRKSKFGECFEYYIAKSKQFKYKNWTRIGKYFPDFNGLPKFELASDFRANWDTGNIPSLITNDFMKELKNFVTLVNDEKKYSFKKLFIKK